MAARKTDPLQAAMGKGKPQSDGSPEQASAQAPEIVEGEDTKPSLAEEQATVVVPGTEVPVATDQTAQEPESPPVTQQRPCLEEFLAAGYKTEQYDGFFPASKGWGPGWSDPNWKPPAPPVDDDEEEAPVLNKPVTWRVTNKERVDVHMNGDTITFKPGTTIDPASYTEHQIACFKGKGVVFEVVEAPIE